MCINTDLDPLGGELRIERFINKIPCGWIVITN